LKKVQKGKIIPGKSPEQLETEAKAAKEAADAEAKKAAAAKKQEAKTAAEQNVKTAEAALETAKRNFETAEGKLSTLKESIAAANKPKLDALVKKTQDAEAAVKSAEDALAKAKGDAKTVATNNLNLAQENYRAAQNELVSAVDECETPEFKEARQKVEEAKDTLTAAEANLLDAKEKAKAAGSA
jgi:hypothetical protein